MRSVRLTDAHHDEQSKIRIAYRINGLLPIGRRMQAPTGLSTTYVLNTETKEDMRRNSDHIAAGVVNFGTTINENRTI
ncbi:unnamed protein product [Dibothriocephalus latus]|uniref:Uncharacterized protein n=1 Tax=Dibothriocephalus latus TaxID=60516 RepID=A0A3P7MNJ5_DIBLA|nr:unnamed protein product [Dibothriocephalus latus]